VLVYLVILIELLYQLETVLYGLKTGSKQNPLGLG